MSKTLNDLTNTINALSVLPNRFTTKEALKELGKQNLSNFALQNLYITKLLLRPDRGVYIKTEAYYKKPVKEVYADLMKFQKDYSKTRKAKGKPTDQEPGKNLVPINEAIAIKYLKSLGYKIMKAQTQYTEI